MDSETESDSDSSGIPLLHSGIPEALVIQTETLAGLQTKLASLPLGTHDVEREVQDLIQNVLSLEKASCFSRCRRM